MLVLTYSVILRTDKRKCSAEKMIESKRSIFANALRKHFFPFRCWHSMRECSHAVASDPKMDLKCGLLSFNVFIFREITPPYLNGGCCPKFNPIYKAAYNSQQLPHPSSAFFMSLHFLLFFFLQRNVEAVCQESMLQYPSKTRSSDSLAVQRQSIWLSAFRGCHNIPE